jgi:predicted PolB exonuclease-like 3'-5' exonuclease
MLDQLKIGNILFLDIETVPAFPAYEQIPEPLRILWEKKAAYLRKETETPDVVYQKAGIYAEFGRIVCISTGMIGLQDEQRVLRLKSFYAAEEKVLLAEFADLITRLCQKREIDLCAHNGKEFDFPYIARRMLINGVPLPLIFDNAGKKPWEVRYIDTLELWKFGDHKHYTSLDLLTSLFGIESPKSEMDGSQVSQVYWQENNLSRIVEYCRRDVIATAQIMLRFKGEPPLVYNDIIILDTP